MKMAKASEKDIDAAGDAMSVLQDISSGYYPKRDGDECEDFRFDPEDPAHLRKFYDLMSATRYGVMSLRHARRAPTETRLPARAAPWDPYDR